jgi:transposase
MKILDQLDELNLDATAKTQVAALVQLLLDQVKKEEAEKYETDIQAKDLKIQALILELAHLRRLRYGIKNEALSGIQRDLFEETCNEDIAALEAEVEQFDDQAGATVTKPKRPRAGRQPLPPHLPRIEHRHEPHGFLIKNRREL